MSYLICKKCLGYYKIKKGETPEDFESPQNLRFWGIKIGDFECCQCGGAIKYVQNFNVYSNEEVNPINEINTCFYCGTKNFIGEKNCKSCDKTIKNIKNKEVTSSGTNKRKRVLKESKTHNYETIRIMAIIMGILIVLIPASLPVNQDYSLLLLVMGGAAASFIAGGKNEDNVLNGAILGLIAGSILLIFKGNFMFSNDIAFNIGIITDEMSGTLLILTISGLIGAVIGILIRRLLVEIKMS